MAVFLWMEARLFLVGNLFFVSTALTCAFFIFFEIDFDYTSLAFTMTYSMLAGTSVSDLIFRLCGVE